MNTELITVEAGGTVTIKSAVYSSDGPASSDARTMALAHASGIDSGADDDKVTNAETILVTAAPRILSATRTFGSGGKVDGKVGILLDADAQGIAGGEGDDLITNEGNILVFLGSPATESTVSEDATSGATTFTDNKRIGEDPEAIIEKWVRLQASDGRNFVTSVEAFDPATGTFTLHDPIKYDLTVNDGYTLYDYGDKTPDIESVQVTVGGRTRVDASTTASLRATGIEGGDGDDEIMNSGAIEVKASNLIKTVSVTIGRDIDADSNTESTVNVIGIAGDGKADTSDVTKESAGGTVTFIDKARIGEDPDAIVGKRIRFKTGEAADFFTVVEGFDPETGTFTLRDPIPKGGLSTNDIYALGGGSNTVTNLGTIDVKADATIDASGWVLNFGGSPNIDSEGRTQAISTGVQVGEYDDFFKNTKRIETYSSADVTSVQRATVIFGGAEQELVFEARSESVGMSTGAGDDIIVNGEGVSAELAAIDVDANATANVDGVTTSIFGFGETNNLVDARSVSTAMGLDLGEGENIAYNSGQVNVSAKSTTTATAISDDWYDEIFDIWHKEANARANAAATAIASGISAEDGGDTVQSSGGIIVGATAAADSFAQGSDVIGGSENDFNSAVTKDSSSGSMTFIDASLIAEAPEDIAGQWVRFLTGDNENFTTLVTGFDPGTGTIILAEPLPADLKEEEVDDDDNITPADEYTLANGRDGESGAFANAFATGIDLNNGLVNSDTVVEIEGTLVVTAYAQADSTAYAYYNGSANAGATATAEARGIVTGDGNDVVRNDGTIRVEAEALTSASGAGVTENITATATGIDTGAGNDTIWNGGSIITGEKEDDSIIAGNAILTGPGNDTVILGDLSSTVGHIDLGADNDILHLIGSPVVSGNILPDTDVNSIDSLIFEGQGSFANSLQGFDRATKQKAGIYSVASLPSLQRMEMIEGTLQINSDYTFAEDGLFLAHIYSDSSHGKLQVIGNVVLDGELQALRNTGAYLNGTKYHVLEGTSVDAESHFSNVVVPEPSTLLSFDVHQLSNAVEVEVLAKSFTTVAKEKSHLFIAQYLDKVMLTATGDLSNIIGELQLLPADEFSAAFSSLIPRIYEQSGQVTFSASGQYINTVHNHMNSFRRSAGLTEEWRNKKGSKRKPILLAYNGSLLSIGSLLDPDDSAQRETEFGMWIRGIGQWGEQDKKDGF
ncbi:MAG: hypothetical protein GQ578_05710, partial [Desulfuromonadaceae bacterium]|nr:hypothetical protein [Desulfuromonadaceae bacterium]